MSNCHLDVIFNKTNPLKVLINLNLLLNLQKSHLIYIVVLNAIVLGIKTGISIMSIKYPRA